VDAVKIRPRIAAPHAVRTALRVNMDVPSFNV
jgi:hypothetical protein